MLSYRMQARREQVGDLELEIHALEDLDATIDALFLELEKSGNTALLEELCPYFGQVWPSARLAGCGYPLDPHRSNVTLEARRKAASSAVGSGAEAPDCSMATRRVSARA